MVVRTTTIESIASPFKFRRAVAWTEALTLAALFSFVGATAVIVGPRLLRVAAASATTDTTLSTGLLEQESMLRGLLERSSGILSIHYGQPDAAQLDMLVLWVADDRFPGRVNLSEVLVVRFSPVLRSIIACTWSPSCEDDLVLSESDLQAPHRLEELAGRPDVVRAVIAQPVVACEVTGITTAQPIRPDASAGELVLRLTWFDESTDSRGVSTIRTELRLLARANRL